MNSLRLTVKTFYFPTLVANIFHALIVLVCVMR